MPDFVFYNKTLPENDNAWLDSLENVVSTVIAGLIVAPGASQLVTFTVGSVVSGGTAIVSDEVSILIGYDENDTSIIQIGDSTYAADVAIDGIVTTALTASIIAAAGVATLSVVGIVTVAAVGAVYSAFLDEPLEVVLDQFSDTTNVDLQVLDANGNHVSGLLYKEGLISENYTDAIKELLTKSTEGDFPAIDDSMTISVFQGAAFDKLYTIRDGDLIQKLADIGNQSLEDFLNNTGFSDGNAVNGDLYHEVGTEKWVFGSDQDTLSVFVGATKDGLDSFQEFVIGGQDIVVVGDGASISLNGDTKKLIVGADGSETLIGGVGEDWIFGGDLGDDLRGGDGNDFIFGDGVYSVLNGEVPSFGGTDFLNGGSGDDFLYGGQHKDILEGGAGKDELYGGTGDDEFVGNGYDSGDGTSFWLEGDKYHGGFNGINFADDGSDTVDYRGLTFGINAEIMNANEVEVRARGVGGNSQGLKDNLISIEKIIGSNHDDNFIINGFTDHVLDGAGGTNTITLAFEGKVYDGNSGKVYDDNGTNSAVVEDNGNFINFEEINYSADVIIPDFDTAYKNFDGDGGLAGYGTIQSAIIDYTAAETALTINARFYAVGDYEDDNHYNSPVAASVTGGGINHQLALPTAIHGSHHGDTYSTHWFAHTSTFFTGTGNDTFFMEPASTGAVYYNYSGGDDVIHATEMLKSVTLAETITLDDISVSISDTINETNASIARFTATLSIANHGSITIDYDDINGHDIFVSLLSGGQIRLFQTFQSGVGFNDYQYSITGTSTEQTELEGTWGDDSWSGRAGYDQTYYAKGGNDVLDGNDGIDLLHGGDGDDTLTGGSGNDEIYGGDGNDTAVFEDVFSNYTLTLQANRVLVTHSISGEMDTVSVDVENYQFSDAAYGINELFNIDTGQYDNYEEVRGTETGETLFGTSPGDPDEVLFGLGGDDSVFGQNGNDILFGDAGNDTLNGGNGNDILVGGNGDDTLLGFDGQDTAVFSGALADYTINKNGSSYVFIDNVGNDGTDTVSDVELFQFSDGFYTPADFASNITGTSQGNFIVGDEFSNNIFGLAGTDTLIGLGGDDSLYGGSGNDFLQGDAGNDLLVGNEGNDELLGGAGFDKAQFGGVYSNYIIIQNGNQLIVEDLVGTDGDDIVRNDVEQIIFADGVYENGVFTATSTNNQPVAINDAAVVDEDGSVTFTPKSNDTDADSDTITITGVNSAANGSVVLNLDNTVTYTPNANYNGADSFTYSISDGNGGTDTATVSVTVNAVNDTPDAQNDTVITDEGAVITFSPLSNDLDIDGDILSISSVTQGSNGSVFDNGDGRITYTPDANYNGVDSFTYTVNDGNGGTDTATVNITVNAVNDAPILTNNGSVVDEDGAVVLTTAMLGATDTDNTASELLFTLSSAVNNGALKLNTTTLNGSDSFTLQDVIDGNVSFAPNANYNGADSFDFTLSDGIDTLAADTFNIIVNAINDGPVAQDDAFTGDEDVSIVGNVLVDNGNGADSDIDGDALSVTAGTFATVQGGSVVVSANGDFTYTGAAGFTGTDSFDYTLLDGQGGSDVGTLTLDVDSVASNPPLDFNNENITSYSGSQNASDEFVVEDNGATLHLSENTWKKIDFPYTVTADTVIEFDFKSTAQGEIHGIGFDNNDSLSSNRTFKVYGTQNWGISSTDTYDGSGDWVHYTVNVGDNYTGAMNYLFFTNDHDVSNPNAESFFRNVTVYEAGAQGVNIDPVAVDDTIVVDEDSNVTLSPKGNDTDADLDTLDIISVGNAANGSVVLNPDNTVTYTPNTNYNGADSFTYTISDGNGGTDTATVNVTVNAVNDAPVLSNNGGMVDEDGSLILTTAMLDAADIDNTLGELVFTIDAVPSNGGVELSGAALGVNDSFTLQDVINGVVTFEPDAHFNGIDGFDFTLSDGADVLASAVFGITVNAVNDGPEAQNDAFTGSEDAGIVGNVLADNGNGIDSDLDGDALSVTAGTFATAQGGSVVVSANGDFTYTSTVGFNGADSFDYTLLDGNGGTDVATVSLTVNAVNDAPILTNNGSVVDEDGAVVLTTAMLGATDTDNTPSELVFTLTSAMNNGVLKLNATTLNANDSFTLQDVIDGSVSFAPNANYNGADSFDFTLSDGTNTLAVDTFNIAINAVNDGPMAQDDVFTGDEDIAIVGNVLADNGSGADNDIDGDTLSVTAGTFATAQGGSVVISANGDFTYTAATSFTGADSFDYTLLDGQGGSDVGTANFSVQAVTTNQITGTAGNDTLNGTAGDDEIYGLGGRDYIYANDGEDTVYGGDGNDYVYGRNDNDTLYGDSGNDTVSGDNGEDILYGGIGNDTLRGGNDNDILYGEDGYDTLEGGAGNDTLDGGAGLDIAKFASSTSNLVVNLSTGIATSDNYGTDTLINIERVYGSNNADHLTGNDQDNLFRAEDGDDVVYGLGGNDILWIDGGDNQLYGGDGDDKFYIYGGTGSNIINGGAGIDEVQYDFSPDLDSVTVNLQTGEDDLNGDSVADNTLISIENVNLRSTGNNVIHGNDDANSVTSWKGSNTVYGHGGDDSINTSSADNQYLYGGAGDDSFSTQSGVDYLDGEAGDDYLYSGYGDDTLLGSSGDDDLRSSNGADLLSDGSGNDDLQGGNDDDILSYTLSENVGNVDVFYGNRGADTLRLYFTAAEYNASGMAAELQLYEDFLVQNYDVTDHWGNDFTFSFGLTAETFETLEVYVDGTLQSGAQQSMALRALPVDSPTTSYDAHMMQMNDQGTVESKNVDTGVQEVFTILKESLEDGLAHKIVDFNTNDGDVLDLSYLVDGYDSNQHEITDFVQVSKIGDSTVVSVDFDGAGDGGVFQDVAVIDYVAGIDSGALSISLERGEVASFGTSEGDVIKGENEADSIYGLSGSDIIYGYSGDDNLFGNDGHDVLRGNAGNDVLFGGEGKDRLYGGNDDDILYGQDGFDKLWGGNGADTFVFEADSAFNNVDVIKDFDATEDDAIDISDVVSAYDPLSNAISDFVEVTTAGKHSYISVDVDGGADNYVRIAKINNTTDIDLNEMITNNELLVA